MNSASIHDANGSIGSSSGGVGSTFWPSPAIDVDDGTTFDVGTPSNSSAEHSLLEQQQQQQQFNQTTLAAAAADGDPLQRQLNNYDPGSNFMLLLEDFSEYFYSGTNDTLSSFSLSSSSASSSSASATSLLLADAANGTAVTTLVDFYPVNCSISIGSSSGGGFELMHLANGTMCGTPIESEYINCCVKCCCVALLLLPFFCVLVLVLAERKNGVAFGSDVTVVRGWMMAFLGVLLGCMCCALCRAKKENNRPESVRTCVTHEHTQHAQRQRRARHALRKQQKEMCGRFILLRLTAHKQTHVVSVHGVEWTHTLKCAVFMNVM